MIEVRRDLIWTRRLESDDQTLTIAARMSRLLEDYFGDFNGRPDVGRKVRSEDGSLRRLHPRSMGKPLTPDMPGGTSGGLGEVSTYQTGGSSKP